MRSPPPWQLYPIASFDSHSASWDTLNQANAQLPILDSDFVRPLLKYFATGRETLAIYRVDDEVLAMAIIHRYKLGCWMTFQPSQAPLGCWLQSPSLSMAALIGELKKTLPFPTLILSVTQQDPNITARPATSKNLTTLDYINTASIPLAGSFEDYWAQRSKNTRQNFNRQRNRLAREGLQTRLNIITDRNQVADAIAAYGQLESDSWKQEQGTAIHANNNQGHFYHELLDDYSEKNKGVIFQYFYDQELVASDLCIHNERAFIILKTAFNGRMANTSPAMQMHHDIIRHIFESNISNNIEFYGREMNWHMKLTRSTRALYHLNHASSLLYSLKNISRPNNKRRQDNKQYIPTR